MKVLIVLTVVTMLFANKANSQSVSYTEVDSQSESDIRIMDVVWLSNSLAVHFFYADTKTREGRPYIYLAKPGKNDAMFIMANGKRYNLIKTEDIADAPNKMYIEFRRIYEFTAYFEKIPFGIEKINLLEGEAGSWNFYGIQLRKPNNLSKDTYSTIQMQRNDGVYFIPCKVNGLPLKFVFDTGASDVSISITEALFMLKNGFWWYCGWYENRHKKPASRR